MDKIIAYKETAVKELQMAAYLLSTAYKMAKEPKNLLLISNHVRSSFSNSLSALLFFERSKKLIPPYHETDESKLGAFKEHLIKKYGLVEYYDIMKKLVVLPEEHKNASVEFTRNGKFVMCAPEFKKIEILSEQDVISDMRKAKEFITKIERIVVNE
jgi:hypothetical protein